MQVKEAARRLCTAVRQKTQPSKRLGARTQAALEMLLCSNSTETAVSAVEAIAWGTQYSRSASKWIVASCGIEALVKCLHLCQRSKLHQTMLSSVLHVVTNLLSWGDAAVPLAPSALATLVEPLTDVLWRFRRALLHSS
jgi:hypothetical protein